MPIRITGLNSGLDTESIISALVSSYNYKTQKYEKAQTKLAWKQDAWKSLNTKIYSLYTSVGNLRYSSAYNMKSATVSDSTKVSVTAGAKAVNGNYSIQVTSLAKTGYLTGGKLKTNNNTDVKSSTTLSELGYSGGDKTITVNGKSITVNEGTKISKVVSDLNNAGVNASFDAENDRIYISAKSAGAENDFSLSGAEDALKALGLVEDVTGEALTLKEENASLSLDTKYSELSGSGDTVGKIIVNGTEISIGADDTIQDIIDKLKTNAKVDASFDATSGKISIQKSDTGEAVTIEAADGDETALNALGLKEFAGATRVKGSNAVIYVNDAKYESNSNSFSVNGLTITATGITNTSYDPTKEVTATVSVDTQGLYDKIKDFLSQYNSIINEMTALYNADSAKGYEPLTDEEKDAMSDTEVEKWEEKIKASLLRRDDTLSGLISSMTNAMSKGVNIDLNGNGTIERGETYYLSSFGIKTLGYFNAPKNEQNAYHIDGDEDDVNTSGNGDILMSKIASDPDTVISFMQGLTSNLYNAVHGKMSSSTLSSVYTVYNDKEMAAEYSDYTSLINKWQERLEKQQDYYYEKFAAMESALSKINSQTSSLSGFFG